MIWITRAISFITGNSLLAAVAAGLVAFWGWSAYQRSLGAATATANIEKQNARTVTQAHRAASKSRDPSASGMLNPYVRDD